MLYTREDQWYDENACNRKYWNYVWNLIQENVLRFIFFFAILNLIHVHWFSNIFSFSFAHAFQFREFIDFGTISICSSTNFVDLFNFILCFDRFWKFIFACALLWFPHDFSWVCFLLDWSAWIFVVDLIISIS